MFRRIGRLLTPWRANTSGLSGHGFGDEQLLRAELFSFEQLEEHAKAMAAWHTVEERPGVDGLLPRLADNERILVEAYQLVAEAAQRGHRLAPAAEWLLDNFHVIEEQIRTARLHLPRGYSRQLPRLTNGPSAGLPRAYEVALELISHADGRIETRSVTSYIAAYQTIAPLKLGELWAVPIMLRLALIENLRRAGTRIAAGRRDRNLATFWADRLLDKAEKDPGHLVLTLADLIRTEPALTSAFVAEFARRIQGHGPAMAIAVNWLEQQLAEHGHTIDLLVHQESQNQAADQVSVGNSIGSLRLLSAIDWREFVETLSTVERTLRIDPTDEYADMDFQTRDTYRHEVERLARRSPLTEEQVATKAIELARESEVRSQKSVGKSQKKTAHVGFYLIDRRGRRQLARACRARVWDFLSPQLSLALYLGSMAILTGLAAAILLRIAWIAGAGTVWTVLLAFPVLLVSSQLALALVNWLVTQLVSPRSLPRMEFMDGIPTECRTLVVVPTMLTSQEAIDQMIEAMEVRFLANRDQHLHFGLLTDLPDAPSEHMPDDEQLVRYAAEQIAALAAKYAEDRENIFYLFHRPRRWNEQEGVWMGWERKRGKLDELNRLLRGGGDKGPAFSQILGETSILPAVRYVITLDSDTQLPRDAARLLAGTLAHPLNAPYFDERLGRVTEGYAILQPRVAIALPSAGRSWFARLFAGEVGIDPYTRAISDVYQDLLGEGSFIGKGIYDVDAFVRACGNRFPENRILSHDLLEGSHARSGLASDVVLFEDFPSRYQTDVGRRHRWMRGDWQIAPWVLPWVPGSDGHRHANPVSVLSRWKIFDNLRRSLVPPALFVLLIVSWLAPAGLAGPLLAAVLAAALIPPLLTATVAFARRPEGLPLFAHGRGVAWTAIQQIVQLLFGLITLPYEAYISVDAVIRTGVRILVTRRLLLEWQAASEAERCDRFAFVGSHLSMWAQPAAALLIVPVLMVLRPEHLPWATPFLICWAITPTIAWWLSRPIRLRRVRLSPESEMYLRALSRRTWRLFDMMIGPGDNYLPPDNIQEDPPDRVAHRTSPTNIGVSMLSHLAAFDFGYISLGRLVERTGRTLATIARLERHHGHLFNWYDTVTLQPLNPQYVSTVDSGNLQGHLLVLASGLEALGEQPPARSRMFTGLEDALLVLLDVAYGKYPGDGQAAGSAFTMPEALPRLERLRPDLQHPPRSLTAAYALLQLVARAAGDFATAVRGLAAHSELRYWADTLERQAHENIEDLVYLAPWVRLPPPPETFWREGSARRVDLLGDVRRMLRTVDEAPSLESLSTLRHTLLTSLDETIALAAGRGGEPSSATAPKDNGGTKLSPATDGWLNQLRACLAEGGTRVSQRLAELSDFASQCRQLAHDMDFGFLYDRSRNLFSIGFNVTDHRLDASFYDLLASEARMASYIAVARGVVPQEHWFSLGRLLTRANGNSSLLSWSGSMFEYLMPMLVMPTYDGTLLDRTQRAVVRRQIEYGRQRHVPWGISESQYNTTDAHLNYQYRAFGVPGLGLKRGLREDLVIAPYATIMALMVDPAAAVANLRRLQRLGAMGPHGFYEAIDFTPTRLPRGQEHVIVRTFMAHHQGMAFLSLAHVLLDRPLQRRFLADPEMRAAEVLLQERVPRASPIFPHAAEVADVPRTVMDSDQAFQVHTSPTPREPAIHLLSNGRYHVMVNAAGGGYSRWRDLAVTRWQEDLTRDCWGTFLYLRDIGSGYAWSASHEPIRSHAKTYETIFSQGRVEYRRRDGGLETHTAIGVSPEDDIELRRVTITNRGRTTRSVELTSYTEVVLAPPADDLTHLAFSKLFVQTQILKHRNAILCNRRPRRADEHTPWMMHLIATNGPLSGETTFETDRDRFIGRGRTTADPAAMHVPKLSNTDGSVLDPVVAVRTAVVLEPDAFVQFDVVSGMADTYDAAVALVEKYHDRRLNDRVLDLAWTHSQVGLRQLDATEADAQTYRRLAGMVLYADPRRRDASSTIIARNRRGQSGLWGYGISGDLPIVLLRIGNKERIALVRQLVQAHAYWRLKGLAVDLLIWNEDQSGYRQVLHDMIMSIVAGSTEAHSIDRPGGIFVRRIDQIGEDDKLLMQTVARAIVTDDTATLTEHLERRPAREAMPPAFVPTRTRREYPVASEIPKQDLAYFNGHGGFTRDGREYVVLTTADKPTPAPWSNVIANAHFGTVVTESGSAYTWCENAHEYRLTPWGNDPVTDSSGEMFYLRDEETGRFWSPTPLPARGPMPYTSRHGFGYSIFEYAEDGIASEMATYVALDAPVKFVVIKIRNVSGRWRRLSVTGCIEWVLGQHRAASGRYVVTEIDPRTNALLARNTYDPDFAARVAFFDVSDAQRTVTGDRAEFLGRNGSPAHPAAMGRTRLSGRVGGGLDPCGAMQVAFDLADGQEREIAFIFGSGRDLDDARTLLQRFHSIGAARRELEEVWGQWNRILGSVYVETEDASVNFLVNGWLLYQTLSCRVWGRSGFYQSGGAFGFRDQLQDVAAMLHCTPQLIREQLIRAAGRQFVEGDVQHWWHPPTGRGVRTRISDDYLWLPAIACRYVLATDDTGILDEKIPFLEGRALNPDEEGYYDMPIRSEKIGSLYEHCVRAIRHGLRVGGFGSHGLPLMGSGDWNDGMNRVGHEGKGESVWLAFFLSKVLKDFAALADRIGDAPFATECRDNAARLHAAIETHGWDGGWYRRAFFDNGEALGSSASPECQIDSLPQSWSVLADVGDAARRQQGMQAIQNRLVREDARLIQLFDPPFDSSHLDPGYIKGYIPGVRENGGQYTHAAVWAVMAFAQMGQNQTAWDLFSMINPVNHGRTPRQIATYRVEPYVVAADVYTNPQHLGRGGWSWYTGSAGWMYRLLTESILGLRLEVDHLRLEPHVPPAWTEYKIHYRYRETFHHIIVQCQGGSRVKTVTLDGVDQPDLRIPLVDDRQDHTAVVELGP